MNSTLDTLRNMSAEEREQELIRIRTPRVERRITTIEHALGLIMLLSRGMERTDDACMGGEDLRAAWSQISTICDHAMESLRAIEAVLPNDVMLLSAPAAQNR
jgi:hypothetical protein